MSTLPSSRDDIRQLSRPDLLAIAESAPWVHSIDLGEGYVTQGQWPGNPGIDRAMDAIDFAGKRVLDIGCWDGRYSFAAEERGASEVFATDLASHRAYTEHPTFEVARAARRSKAVYYPDLSVFDVEALGVEFDVVIFAGVYYHLRDALLAFSTLRRVLRTGGMIIVEGAISDEPGCFARFYYREAYCGDLSNWWVPTIECLRQWIASSRFDITHEYDERGHPDNPRHVVLAEAVAGPDPLHPWPDERLAAYLG